MQTLACRTHVYWGHQLSVAAYCFSICTTCAAVSRLWLILYNRLFLTPLLYCKTRRCTLQLDGNIGLIYLFIFRKGICAALSPLKTKSILHLPLPIWSRTKLWKHAFITDVLPDVVMTTDPCIEIAADQHTKCQLNNYRYQSLASLLAL